MTHTKTLADITALFTATSTRRSVQRAIDAGWTICKWECPASAAREGLDIEEAMEIAAQDPSVLYFTH